MSLSLSQNYSAVAPGTTFVSFLATGGTPAYTYSVLPGGAGGSINSSTGAYSAPSQMTAYPATGLYDQIQVEDSTLATVTSQILVGTPLLLFCDIIQTGLTQYIGLPQGRTFLWDQKIFQPTDSGMYVIVSVESCKAIGNNYGFSTDGTMVQNRVNMYNRLGIDILSRGPSARDQKEFVLLALNSIYSEQQQEANSFAIGRVASNFINLSNVDGAAIPYRFRIECGFQYTVSTITAVPYFNTFETEQIVVNP